MSLFGTAWRFITNRVTKNKSVGELTETMANTGQEVAARFRRGADTPTNRDRIAHITGMERWGQSRLRVFLGEPLKMDEYDGYRPATTATVAELAETFAQTRAETVALGRRLQAAAILPSKTVPHNELGDLTARGWLFYLDNHAWRESFVVR